MNEGEKTSAGVALREPAEEARSAATTGVRKEEGAMKLIARKLAAEVKSNRREVAVLFALLIGLLWLLIAYVTREPLPIVIASLLLLPNILYLFEGLRSKKQ